MTARNNPAERQRLLRSVRQVIRQINFTKTKYPDEGDQILLDIATEDHMEILKSFGVNESKVPTMREILDRVAV